MPIYYLSNAEIDKKKWDECIYNSLNGLIYSTSIYLDTMATNWDALVMDDYAAVMPLPYRKKYRFYYICPPAFTQQMGVTSIVKCNEQLVTLFINAIPSKFKLIQINFNIENVIENELIQKRKNYTLQLHKNYKDLSKDFSRSASRNIKKAKENNITIEENIDPSYIIDIHRNRFKDDVGVTKSDYENFLKLSSQLIKENLIFTIGAYNNDKKLIGGSIYLLYKNRLTFVVNGNTEESLQNGATHLLMDYTINKFSNQDYILDFEGSDTVSFARFYEQYGAIAEAYNFISINKLPWPFSILKR